MVDKRRPTEDNVSTTQTVNRGGRAGRVKDADYERRERLSSESPPTEWGKGRRGHRDALSHNVHEGDPVVMHKS